jgi:hypothetical protein
VEGEKQPTRLNIEDADDLVPRELVVDEVIVDRSWSTDDRKSSLDLDSDDVSISSHYSRTGILPSLSEQATGPHGRPGTLRSYVWFYLKEFFSSRFSDPEIEADFRADMTCGQFTPLKFWTSLFFIANWVLEIAFIPKPVVLADKIFFFAVCAFDSCEGQLIDY